jgi:hypothetical protein
VFGFHRLGPLRKSGPTCIARSRGLTFLPYFKRALSRQVFAERLSLFKKIGQIISRPSEFADKFIIQVEGEQCVDFNCFNLRDYKERMSVGHMRLQGFRVAQATSP